MTEHSLPQFAVHNHHSAAEDLHMLWQQIRHSKEQQTFSASSNRAALSAPAPAAWRYCSQVLKLLRGSALDMLCAHTLTQAHTRKYKHSHTHIDTHTHTNTHTPTHTLVSNSGESLSTLRDIWQGCCLVKLSVFSMCVCVCRCVSGRVCTGLCSANIWSLD